jgi:membrane associated rhomboid family serine protease
METCYRHPGRETGVSCSNCGRPICPDCMTPTSVGMRCPECARQRTKVVTARSLERDPVLTYALIGVNVVVWLGEALGGGSDSAIVRDGILVGPLVAAGDWWRILTSGFLHDPQGPFHLFVNMLALYFLGAMLEPAIGRWRFAAVYFFSLLAGSLGVLIMSPESPTLGASGAIFGLLGAAFMFLRARGVNPMESGIVTIIALNLLITFAFASFISVGGHLGGLAGGFVAGAVLTLGERRRVPEAVPAALVAVLGLVVVVGSIAVADSIA